MFYVFKFYICVSEKNGKHGHGIEAQILYVMVCKKVKLGLVVAKGVSILLVR